MNKKTDCKITIGLPVFNEKKNIENVLKNIFKQNYKKFILIISDNNSNDGTYEICKKWAQRKKQIKLFRQKKTIIRGLNFLFVYEKCKTPYFIWFAADDRRSNSFLRDNLYFLEKNPEFIASCSRSIILNKRQKKIEKNFFLRGKKNLKIFTFLKNCWYSHGVFYSLFRYHDISEIKKYIHYFMWDWIFNIHIICKGDFNRIKKSVFISNYGGVSSKVDYITKYSKNIFEKIFPASVFIFYVIKKTSIFNKGSLRIFLQLLKLFLSFQLRWIKKILNSQASF